MQRRIGMARPLRFAGQRWRVAVLVFLVAALLAAGVGGYLGFGLPPAQAVYLAVLALTTEGFGGGLRLSAGEELFTAGLAVLGVTVFLAVVGVIGTALVDSRAGLDGGEGCSEGLMRCATITSSVLTGGLDGRWLVSSRLRPSRTW